MKFFITASILVSVLSCNGQAQSDRIILGKSYANKELKDALLDTTMHNLVRKGNLLIKTKETAIAIVEPLLFSIYGEENIKGQRPYEAYLINNYWIVSGTLPKDHVGGTFLIIIDGTNSKVIRLTHGK